MEEEKGGDKKRWRLTLRRRTRGKVARAMVRRDNSSGRELDRDAARVAHHVQGQPRLRDRVSCRRRALRRCARGHRALRLALSLVDGLEYHSLLRLSPLELL